MAAIAIITLVILHGSFLLVGWLGFFVLFSSVFPLFFWLYWVFIPVCGISLVAVSRGFSFLWSTGSRCLGFSSCGMQAQQLQFLGSGVQAPYLWCLVAPRHVESSQTRNQTHVLCAGRLVPSQCTSREVRMLHGFA